VVLDQIRRDHLRLQKLFANLTISSNEIEKSQKDLSVAEADLTRSKAAVAEARKNLIVAQNTLDYQRARLDDTITGSFLRRAGGPPWT
jgi:multidrug resistance efflux pump